MNVCIRDFAISKRKKMNLVHPAVDGGTSLHVGPCYKNVESGAYFMKNSYVVYGMSFFYLDVGNSKSLSSSKNNRLGS